jgi:hypothetical protein
MSSYAAIYDFEGQLEDAFRDFLNGEALAAIAPNTTIDFQKIRPRTETMFTEGGADDSHRFKTYDGIYRHDLFKGTLTLELVTATRNDGTAHAQYRAKIRNMMARAKQDVSIGNLELRYIVPTGNSPSIKPDEGLETSTMTFAVTFGVKQSAWPATAEEAYPA